MKAGTKVTLNGVQGEITEDTNIKEDPLKINAKTRTISYKEITGQEEFTDSNGWWYKKGKIFKTLRTYKKDFLKDHYDYGDGTLHEAIKEYPKLETDVRPITKRTTFAKTVIAGTCLAAAAAAWKCYSLMTSKK
jgi:hypothetical protein